jgi:hypothetical protein
MVYIGRLLIIDWIVILSTRKRTVEYHGNIHRTIDELTGIVICELIEIIILIAEHHRTECVGFAVLFAGMQIVAVIIVHVNIVVGDLLPFNIVHPDVIMITKTGELDLVSPLYVPFL